MSKTKPNFLRKCIVKDSNEIRNLLKTRFDKLDLTSRAIVKDAKENKIHLPAASLSRYLKLGNVKGTLSQENIIWLCNRYCIDLKLIAKKRKFTEEYE